MDTLTIIAAVHIWAVLLFITPRTICRLIAYLFQNVGALGLPAAHLRSVYPPCRSADGLPGILNRVAASSVGRSVGRSLGDRGRDRVEELYKRNFQGNFLIVFFWVSEGYRPHLCDRITCAVRALHRSSSQVFIEMRRNYQINLSWLRLPSPTPGPKPSRNF